MTAYERNVAVMAQLYAKKSVNDNSHMMKLLQMTHEVRRMKINSSTLSAMAIKEEYPFFGHKKWVCVYKYVTVHHTLIEHSYNCICNYILTEQSYIVVTVYIYTFIQVEAEFCLMCGSDATEKIAENWRKCVPKILEHGGLKNSEELITETTMLQAMQIMDKHFRPLGAAGKSDAAFTIYEVCVSVA